MKNKKKVVETKKEVTELDEIKKLIFLVLGVTVVFFIFYGITILVLKKDEEKKEVEEKEKVTIDFEKILVSQMLTQPEENYFVLLTIENDDNNSSYETLKVKYYNKEQHNKIYEINLNDPLNKSYLGDKTTLEGEVKDFKFDKSVLVEIEKGTIKTITEGSTDILSKLNELTA